MGDLARTSKTFGVAGTAILHLCIVQACIFNSPRSIIKPVPRIEPVRVSLPEPAPPSLRLPRPTLTPEAPKAKPPEPEPKMPEVEPLAQSPADNSIALVAQQEPVRLGEPVSSPQSTIGHYQGSGRARTREEIEQALLDSVEREKRYPAAARRLGVEGLVIAQVQIDSQGRIVGVNIKGNGADPMLEKATVEALQRIQKKWSPTPLMEAVTLIIPIRYSLER